MPEEQVIVQKMNEPIHLTVTHNAKGKVQHEISIHGADVATVAANVDALEKYMKEKYTGQLASDV